MMSILTDVWYLAGGALLLLGVAAFLAYEWGYIGGRPRLLAMIAQGEHALAKLRARVEAKDAKEAAKAASKAVPVPGTTLEAVAAPAVPTVGDQIISLLEAKNKGALNDEEYAAAKAAILKPKQEAT